MYLLTLSPNSSYGESHCMTGSRSTLAPELFPQLIPTFFTFFISLTLHLPFLQTHLYQGIDRKSRKIPIFKLSRM